MSLFLFSNSAFSRYSKATSGAAFTTQSKIPVYGQRTTFGLGPRVPRGHQRFTMLVTSLQCTKCYCSSPCGLQGTCKPIMNDYSCECPLGLTGARCEHILSGTSLVATETSRQTTRSSLLDNAPAFIGDSFLHYNDQPIAQK